MNELDRVILIKDRAEYSKEGVHKGDVGTIMMGDRNGYVLVFFDGEKYTTSDGFTLLDDIDVAVKIDDLELLDKSHPKYRPSIDD